MKFLRNLILLVLLLIAFLPSLLSTSWGTKAASYLLNKNYGIQIHSLELSWFHLKRIKGISFVSDTTALHIQELVFTKSSFSATAIDIRLNDHTFQIPKAILQFDPQKIGYALSWKNLHIPEMTLSLDPMMWNNSSVLHDLLAIIQLKPASHNDIELLSEPISMSLANGQLHIQHTRFLIDRTYEFVFWNNLDLINSRFNLIIGIPATTITKVFAIPNLPEDYMIPMRLTGPFNNPHLHKSKALKTLGKLLLLKNLPPLLNNT